ncbi:MAG TPA: alpha-N-arabinofuranosidase [Amycolatopsis sp.]|nr:alpha-N-arabinofuranosidase [Amycolatopsis sp.]
MRTSRVFADRHFAVGDVDPRLFGSFVEHLGRGVYTGIFEPGHHHADSDGLRRDVLALVTELGVTTIRYPGGNFVSSYRWEDGVGPVASRPRRLDPAWHSVEPNRFGPAEFVTFAHAAGAEPMLTVNLGTRGVAEAAAFLEYCNHPGGTARSELRARHGHRDPFAVRLWCLGNELDGPWQIGHRTAAEYGRLAAETARAMRAVDPGVELVACGSSSPELPTFGAWDATVLEHTYELVDYLSLHAYYGETDGDVGSFLASAQGMAAFIDGLVATCDAVRARLRSGKRLRLAFDEWNVWHRPADGGPALPEDWPEAPRLLEDVSSVTDAVVVGSLLITLLNHCDRIAVACLAQLVNVLAPIMTEPGGPAWRQTIFHPFADTARHGRGQVLRTAVTSPTYDTARYGRAPLLHLTAVAGEDGWLTVFAVNRDTESPLRLVAELGSMTPVLPAEHRVLTGPDRHAGNTLAHPDRIRPVTVAAPSIERNTVTAVLPALSWNTIRVRCA